MQGGRGAAGGWDGVKRGFLFPILVRKGMARQAAYELVQRNALAVSDALASKQGGDAPGFRQRLGHDPDIASKLSTEELDRAFDLQHHLRWTGEIIDRALRDGGN